MADHACLIVARLLHDPFGTDSQHSDPCQSYEIAAGVVTRACGRVASSFGLDSYHFGAVMVACSILALIAGVA